MSPELWTLSLPFAIYFSRFSLVCSPGNGEGENVTHAFSCYRHVIFLCRDHGYRFAKMQSVIAECCFVFQNQTKTNECRFDNQDPF